MRRPATQAKPALPAATAPVMAGPRLPVWLMVVLLILVTLALYWPATVHDFVNFDDPDYVTANAHVQSGLSWEGVKWACWSPVCCNWHPLTVWSHMLVCQAFGLNPWGHHLTNVLLHALNAGLAFALLQRITGAAWRSLAVAALFAVHPLRVEAVAWVSERKDLLSGFFGLLALLTYAHYAEKSRVSNQWSVISSQSSGVPATDHRPRTTDRRSLITDHRSLFYLLSLFCFALGLMSKPMLVTWPCVMLLLDYWPLKRNAEWGMRNVEPGARGQGQGGTLAWRKLVGEKAPFFALAVAGSVVTFVVQQHGGAVAAGEKLPLGRRGGNALVSYCRYLGKLFWPAGLAVYYPHPGHWPLGKVLLGGGLLLGISVLLVVGRRREPFLLVGWLWFVGMLVPVIGLVQVGEQAMADRYTYLPLLGALVLAVWGAYELTRGWRHQVLALSAAGSAAIVLCFAQTRQQLGHWQDSETLFRHALDVTKNNYLAYNNLAYALNQKGQTDEAIRQYQAAIRLKPAYADFHDNLGLALVKKGQIGEAIRPFQEAIRLKPGYADAHNNLGYALARKGQTDEAIRQYQEAIRLKPDYADAHNNLGNALVKKGQTEEALSQFQEAIRLKPGYAEAHNNLGIALARKGQTDQATGQFQKALRLKPDYAEAHNNLGLALVMKGQTGQAIRHFEEALRLKGDYGDARRNLEAVLATRTPASPQPPGAATNR
jgi:protein O-mannosyl-transferase